ncbi:MFS transporter [Candidatus Bathyarchaeota archaeon]|nr:MFS transporter [Candidatus Bathyarchaeota archaeon]
MENSTKRKAAYFAILLLGIVSLMGDVVYEGSRSIIPVYLGFLGTSAFFVVFIGPFGEFLGYALRLVSGAVSDKTRAYWLLIFLGYGLIVSLPLLGLTSLWQLAIVLVLLERIGKALRSPPRDAVISMIGKEVGVGKAFGIHEFLDQVGAVLGPLIVAGLMFYSNNNYRFTFSFLVIPFMILLAALTYTYSKIGGIKPSESSEAARRPMRLGKPFYFYVYAVMLNALIVVPYEFIAYRASMVLQPWELWVVPLIYLIIQLVDAPSALLSGYAFDRVRLRVLTLPFVLSMLLAVVAVLGSGFYLIIFAAILRGLILGMQESVYRAAVSDFAPATFRGTAYGVFNTVYGVGLLLSGVLYGLIAAFPQPSLLVVLLAVVTQSLALFLLVKAHKSGRLNK